MKKEQAMSRQHREIAERIEARGDLHPSADERDYVYDAEQVLGVKLPEGIVEEIADAIFEDAGETLTSPNALAAFIVDQITEKGYGPRP